MSARPEIPDGARRRLALRAAALAAAWAACTALALPAAAQPLAPPPVELTVEGIFGHDALLSGGYTTVVVRAGNRTASALRGEVTLEARTWERIVSVHRAPLDLPPREGRYTTITLPAFEDGMEIQVRFRADGSELATASTSLSYAGGAARPIVLLDDPPRLRATLVGTQVSMLDPSGYGGPREVEVPIGLATTDARSGDLVLPDSAAGWSSVLLAIGTVPALGRAGEAELVALERWVHAGGHVVVMPTRPSDLDHPWLRRTVGALRRGAPDPTSVAAVLGAEEPPLACPEGASREVFGCQQRVGFGSVIVTDLDLSDASVVNRGEVQSVLRAIARATASGEDRVRPYLAFARGVDRPAEPWAAGPNVSVVRSALDPNEGYRPALVLVGVVLLAYVVLVGPVNFTVVERRKQPTLALVTTPILALICVMATFLVGYVGKGVLMRYRRVELLDVVDGSDVATRRSYTGYFYTRPSAADVELAPGAVAVRLGASGGDGPVTVEGAEHRTLASMRAGLWETAFVREDDATPIGGAIRFELMGDRIARVRNDSGIALRGAFMTDLAGGVYALGEIPAGGAVDVPTVPSSYLPVGTRPDGQYYPGSDAFLGSLGYQTDVTDVVLGLLSLGADAPASTSLPTLFARLDPGPAPSASPAFAAELDVRMLRVVPRMPAPTVYVPGLPVASTLGALEPGSLSDLLGGPAAPVEPQTGGAP